jgi:hypothetical protein
MHSEDMLRRGEGDVEIVGFGSSPVSATIDNTHVWHGLRYMIGDETTRSIVRGYVPARAKTEGARRITIPTRRL